MSLWLVPALCAALFWAVANILDKVLLAKYSVPPVTYITFDAWLGLVPALLLFVIKPVHVTAFSSILLSLCAGFAFTLWSLLYALALGFGDIQAVVLLMQLSTVGTIVVGAVVFNDRFSAIAYIGMALILLASTYGAILNGADDRSPSNKENMRPVRNLVKLLSLMLPGIMLLTASSSIQKYALHNTSPVDVYVLGRLGSLFAAILVVLLTQRHYKEVALVPALLSLGKAYGLRPIGFLLLQEALNLGALYCMVIAFAHAALSLVITVASTQPLILAVLLFLASRFFRISLPHMDGKGSWPLRLGLGLAVVVGIFLLQL